MPETQRRTTQRCINWRGEPSRDALDAGAWYGEETRRYWAEDEAEDWYTVPCLPEEDRKGEP